jgi:hypothetical protein
MLMFFEHMQLSLKSANTTPPPKKKKMWVYGVSKNTELYADSIFVEMGSENVINKSYMQKSLEKLQYLKCLYFA